MENTSDQILKSLEARKKELEEKVSMLKFSEEELARVSAAIKALTGHAIEIVANSRESSTPSTQYDKKAKWVDKIKFALEHMGGSGKVSNIANFIMDKDPDLEPKLIYASVAQNVGKLVEAGELDAENAGRGNLYTLKTPRHK